MKTQLLGLALIVSSLFAWGQELHLLNSTFVINETDSTVTTGNVIYGANAISTLSGNFNLITETGGIFKFDSSGFRAGSALTQYIRMGHDSSNASINVVGRGGLQFQFGGITLLDLDSTGILSIGGDLDANGFNIWFDPNTGIRDINGNEILIFDTVSSAVNSFTMTNGNGNDLLLSATGDDADVAIKIKPKGTERVKIRGGLIVTTTTDAFIVPRLTTTQRNALTPSNGMIIYNTTDNKFQGWANGSWTDLH